MLNSSRQQIIALIRAVLACLVAMAAGAVILWLAIAATVASFWRYSRIAAILLIPYLAWVTYATTLNFGFWQLNIQP